ncbi:MAG: hypothetical protein CMB80_34380 [Flammeovirgaceae bacterium]|nr:hypothetical protein [Flammeovirgaceae bacterium]MBE63599.1 hypothetical protein [Flammeovirgaceae bacterium]
MSYTFLASTKLEVFSNFLNLESISEINQFDIVYQPLIEEFKTKVLCTKEGELIIRMESFNTIRTQILFSLFKFLQHQKGLGAILKITWKVPLDNIKMLETAMDFAELYELQIAISID